MGHCGPSLVCFSIANMPFCPVDSTNLGVTTRFCGRGVIIHGKSFDTIVFNGVLASRRHGTLM